MCAACVLWESAFSRCVTGEFDDLVSYAWTCFFLAEFVNRIAIRLSEELSVPQVLFGMATRALSCHAASEGSISAGHSERLTWHLTSHDEQFWSLSW